MDFAVSSTRLLAAPTHTAHLAGEHVFSFPITDPSASEALASIMSSIGDLLDRPADEFVNDPGKAFVFERRTL